MEEIEEESKKLRQTHLEYLAEVHERHRRGEKASIIKKHEKDRRTARNIQRLKAYQRKIRAKPKHNISNNNQKRTGQYNRTVIAIPVIQFIIGDCKGNDLLCGRKGGHHLNMKGLCRDCNIAPKDGDKISS